MAQKPIIIVTGLPRCGTSLMMNMLRAGGVKILTDNLRRPDKDNPLGYFEFEKVKELPDNASWLKKSRGKAIKVISKLLKFLPEDNHYQIVFMHRQLEEILASQKKMLKRRRVSDQTQDEELGNYFKIHLKKVIGWIKNQKNMDLIEVNYNRVLTNPEREIKKINEFLGGKLVTKKMIKIINPRLYRNRNIN